MKTKDLFCNVRFEKTQNSFHKIQMVHKYHKFYIITLKEPFREGKFANTKEG